MGSMVDFWIAIFVANVAYGLVGFYGEKEESECRQLMIL
jgi:hypothetical protein